MSSSAGFCCEQNVAFRWGHRTPMTVSLNFIISREVSTYATFSTPMARRALQFSIISAQHFCTRRAARRYGFSAFAVIEVSVVALENYSVKDFSSCSPIILIQSLVKVSMASFTVLAGSILEPDVQIDFHFVNKIRNSGAIKLRFWSQIIVNRGCRAISGHIPTARFFRTS
jgi:hypothetical protein